MPEKWKAFLEEGEHVGVIFMDLLKAFDAINHDLLLAKLKAYGFSHNAMAFMLSYLKIDLIGWISITVLGHGEQ